MKLTSFFAVLLGYSTTSHGWVMDSSCSAYSQLIKDGMNNAFDLAQAGSDTFGITLLGSGPKWQAQKDLISYMFSEALTNGNIDTGNKNWQLGESTFASVLKYNTNNGQPDATPASLRSLNTNSLIVYCDYSRFKEGENCDGVKKDGYTCDTSIGISMPMGDIYDDCKSTSFFSSTEISAWTTEYASLEVNRASQIQMCPSFLKSQQKLKLQSLKDQGKKASLARSKSKVSAWLDDPFKTAIDVAYLFEGTMLHEMTHAIPNAATVDAGPGKVGKTDSYGWKNCRKMSGNGGITNADSYALFGIGSRMIAPNNGATAQRPMADGSIQVLPGEASGSKRNLPARAANANITLTIDHATVTLDNANATGFVFSEPGSAPVTISKGRAYTIGTDVLSLDGSAIIEDKSTVFFVPASATTGHTSSSSIISSRTSQGFTTLSTSARSQNSSTSTSSLSSSGSSSSVSSHSSSSGTISSGKSPISSLSTSNSSSIRSLSSTNSVSKTSVSSQSATKSSSGQASVLSSSSTSSSSQSISKNTTTTAAGLSSKSSVSSSQSKSSVSGSLSSSSLSSSQSSNSLAGSITWSGSWTDTTTATPASFAWLDVPSTTISDQSATSEAVLLGGLFFGLKTNRQWLTDSKLKSQYLDDVKRTQDEAESLFSDLTNKPDMPDCSNTKKKRNSMSERQLRSLLQDRSIIGSMTGAITGALNDVSKLVSCATNVVKNLADEVEKPTPDVDLVENLTDTLAEIAEDLQNEDKQQSSSPPTSTAPTSTASKSSSSCSTQTKSACDTSLSVFTPSGATTQSTSTITLSCSTVTACSASLTGSTTTNSAAQITVTITEGDYANAYDTFTTDWYDLQQSILAEAMADDTDAYITWSSDEATTTGSISGSITASANSSSTSITASPSSSPKASSASITASSTTSQKASPSGQPTASANSTSSIPASLSTSSKGTISKTSSLTITSSASANATSSSSPTTTRKTTSAPAITSCTLSSVTAFSSAYSYYTIDYPSTIECACNDGWTAGVGTSVGADHSITYTCEVGSTLIAVSTAPPKTTAPAKTTAPPAPAYQTGTCDLHIFEASESYNAPLYVQLNITDGGNNLLASTNTQGTWGDTISVTADESKLPYDINVDFLKSTKVPRSSGPGMIKGRIAVPPPEPIVRWEDWKLTIAAGDTKWDDTDTDENQMPWCSVGAWDNGNFWDWLDSVISLGMDEGSPNRQMDCHWAC